MQGLRYTCNIVLILIGAVWITSCGESEYLSKKARRRHTKTILTNYARHTFGKGEFHFFFFWR